MVKYDYALTYNTFAFLLAIIFALEIFFEYKTKNIYSNNKKFIRTVISYFIVGISLIAFSPLILLKTFTFIFLIYLIIDLSQTETLIRLHRRKKYLEKGGIL